MTQSPCSNSLPNTAIACPPRSLRGASRDSWDNQAMNRPSPNALPPSLNAVVIALCSQTFFLPSVLAANIAFATPGQVYYLAPCCLSVTLAALTHILYSPKGKHSYEFFYSPVAAARIGTATCLLATFGIGCAHALDFWLLASIFAPLLGVGTATLATAVSLIREHTAPVPAAQQIPLSALLIILLGCAHLVHPLLPYLIVLVLLTLALISFARMQLDPIMLGPNKHQLPQALPRIVALAMCLGTLVDILDVSPTFWALFGFVLCVFLGSSPVLQRRPLSKDPFGLWSAALSGLAWGWFLFSSITLDTPVLLLAIWGMHMICAALGPRIATQVRAWRWSRFTVILAGLLGMILLTAFAGSTTMLVPAALVLLAANTGEHLSALHLETTYAFARFDLTLFYLRDRGFGQLIHLWTVLGTLAISSFGLSRSPSTQVSAFAEHAGIHSELVIAYQVSVAVLTSLLAGAALVTWRRQRAH